jgi:diaminopimelate epimerase
MQNVSFIEITSAGYILDTGSPHFVQFKDEMNSINVKKQGSLIRYSERFNEKGINVNFCEWNKNELNVRTYERGVENETYSCGTGVVASSISYALEAQLPDGVITIPISTRGGRLSVSFKKNGSQFTDIELSGPTVKICEGYYYV